MLNDLIKFKRIFENSKPPFTNVDIVNNKWWIDSENNQTLCNIFHLLISRLIILMYPPIEKAAFFVFLSMLLKEQKKKKKKNEKYQFSTSYRSRASEKSIPIQ